MASKEAMSAAVALLGKGDMTLEEMATIIDEKCVVIEKALKWINHEIGICSTECSTEADAEIYILQRIKKILEGGK